MNQKKYWGHPLIILYASKFQSITTECMHPYAVGVIFIWLEFIRQQIGVYPPVYRLWPFK
jgi:hypothetical protein